MIQLQLLGDLEIQEIMRTGDERAINEADILILSRIHGEGAEECPFQGAKDKGVKIVFECDDDLTDRYRDLGRGHEIEATMEWADACTVSTSPLGKVMEQFGKPTYVLPNRLDTTWYHQVARDTPRQIRGVTVGLVGTRTHFFDWIIVLEALKIIKEKYPHVQVLTGGYPAPFMKQVPGTLHMASVPFQQYPGMLAQVDIRLLPLDTDDKFNESKSGIGAMEAMASLRVVKGRAQGCIPIASDCPTYRAVINPGITGLLVENTTDAWVEALDSLLSNYGHRRRMAQACGLRSGAFDVNHGLKERLEAYQEIA
jgi:glycosyltransferase involved in cell wall biosynthesis